MPLEATSSILSEGSNHRKKGKEKKRKEKKRKEKKRKEKKRKEKKRKEKKRKDYAFWRQFNSNHTSSQLVLSWLQPEEVFIL